MVVVTQGRRYQSGELVARTALNVRPATERDLPALLAFGDELRDQLIVPAEGGRSRGAILSARAESSEQRYREALIDPERHLVVVTGPDGEPLGMALFTVDSTNALVDLPALHMSHAMVADRHKRRGAGKALVAAAAAFAEQRGLDQLVVSVAPGSRDANRFFARLGFAPLAVRRVAPVAQVRRQLAQAESRPLDAVPGHPPRRRRVRLPRIALGSAADTDA